ncbi:glycosyltransferase family 4 protein [Thioalkalivibrio paradoxus]|uniref:Glycosyl transferase family 1 domain-containing protein n=1 Tax=Thioalkalivibrio paradoxus ARh 1 TaxID=713585 RepID=W0DTB1_9GAMM|nr:glycosyltransferase family 1 protein [Thioalkalivibrio paradoxus]AHF00121.1 hypothetical protein THITH_09870 [Thioalkalivibrio paradoxus ARh 1]
MRIVIDMQGAQTASRFRGIGRYTMSFAKAVVHERGEHEAFLALSGLFPDTIEPIRAAFDDLLPQENIRVWHAPAPVSAFDSDNEWRMLAAERIRESFLASLEPDLVLITSLFEGLGDNALTSIGTLHPAVPTAAIFYDLIPMRFPQLLETPMHKEWYQKKLKYLAHADVLLAISDYSRREAMELLKIPAERIVTIGTAIDHRFHPVELSNKEAVALRARFGITRPFIQCTGNVETHKNLRRLIHAFALLHPALRRQFQLVIVARMDDIHERNLMKFAHSFGLTEDELVLTGYVTDEDLVSLYNQCRLFVLPSVHEGFGLPALEAMACGAPTIGSWGGAVPEVIGWEDALFDPYHPDSIAKVMRRALSDTAFRDALMSRAIDRASAFSWKICARRAIAAFSKISQNTGGARNNVIRSQEATFPTTLVDALAGIDSTVSPKTADLCKVATSIALNERLGAEPQMLVDVSVLAAQDARTGVQRVVRNLLKELLNEPPTGYRIRPICFDAEHGWCRYTPQVATLPSGKVEFPDADQLIDVGHGDIFLGLDLSAHLFPSFLSFLRFLRRVGIPIHFVVYDLIPLRHPEWCDVSVPEAFAKWIQGVGATADSLLCISRATADDVRDWLQDHPPERSRPLCIQHFHNGADIASSVSSKGMPPESHDVLAALRTRPSFLMVGTLEPRKGHAQVLASMERLWKGGRDVNLVIVGKQGWAVEKLAQKIRRHVELNARLFWLEGISDEYLQKVYENSTCLIAASYAEGFGLPLIEAAQQGMPIIARDIPVFREVAGNHAHYFDGLEADHLAAALNEWLFMHEEGIAPSSDDMPWMTWRESARWLLSLVVPEGPRDNERTGQTRQTAL